ncbi:hypothetical protein [Echinicola rosea]|uniref:Uncharacterized protein n=1 Tax=Echinicola rosea TaxID=1807691 RepID=A0ABQ1V9W9_9BACT|nr:hypothetical protein [Echinicola rosea]GGF47583.1 hypothetical protein GCM10011339_40170 [Echinicola rosea]
MNTSAYISESIALLQKDFDLSVPDGEVSREQLVRLLTPIVGNLLNRDLERLLQICYRIDLGEERLKRLLHEANPETMAEELSEALVDRQLQKIEIRRKYH